MASLYKQSTNFISRMCWLSPFMGSALRTAKYLLAARGHPLATGKGYYNGLPFFFRNCDLTAVREVLVDREYDILLPFLQKTPEPFIVDVGAHIGTFCIWLHKESPNARIYMVEANPGSHALLVRNTEHRFPQKCWKSFCNAAWKNSEPVRFATEGDTMGNRVSSSGDIKVDGITFKALIEQALKETARIDLMKIDIEGAEEAFFETADSVLDKIDRIIIELHPKSCDTEAVKKRLNKRFKNVREISDRKNDKPVLYCTDD